MSSNLNTPFTITVQAFWQAQLVYTVGPQMFALNERKIPIIYESM